MVNFIYWIIIGTLIGGGLARLGGTTKRKEVIIQILVGITGAAIVGFGTERVTHQLWTSEIHMLSVILSVLGAFALIFIANYLRKDVNS